MRKNLLLFTLQVLVIFFGAFTNTTAQTIDLTTSPYLQNFNGIGGGLPNGVTVRTGATTTAIGATVTLTTAATGWSQTTGAFKNLASATGLTQTTSTADQSSATDRALGVRQGGSFGDPGAAFVFQITNTTNKTSLGLSFQLQSLDIGSTRTTTWSIDYGFGSSPTEYFAPLSVSGSLTTGGATFSDNTVNVNFGNALNNRSEIITIRIVALSASSGSNNRATTGIDNLNITWSGTSSSSPTLTSSPLSLSFPNTAVNSESSPLSFTINGENLIADEDVIVTAPSGYLISKTSSGTYSSSISFPTSDFTSTNDPEVFVKFVPTSVSNYTTSISIATSGASTQNVGVSGVPIGLINLTAPPYLQNFNSIGLGLPNGISGRSGASNSAIGTVMAFTSAVGTTTEWTNTGGGFKNYRSGTDDAPTTDRAFGIRQVTATDAGAAFVFQIGNTANKINFTLDFLLQSLDVSSPRAATWRVDYGVGINPTSFTTATATGNLVTGGNSFSVEPIHVDFGNALDDINDVVTIRIITLGGTSGGGNRPSSAIDDFTLNWQSPTDKTISASVNSINFPATNVNGQTTQTYTVNSTNLTDNLVITATGTFTVSTDGTNFSNSVSVAPPNGTAATIHVRFSPTTTGVFTGTLTHTSTDAFTRVVNVNGEGIDPNAVNFNFNTCTVSNIPGSGFLSINSNGVQKWGCSSFGRNSTNGVDVNGYANGAAQTNEAWLISPVLNLSGFVNMPVLSFYSRGEFSGPKLKLYVSTTYDGVSVPNVANWTEITNANILDAAGSATTVWNLSDNIDLSAYKANPNVRIAFVYTSSSTPEIGAARWSVDDIAITDQSSLLNVSPVALSFGEVAVGAQSVGQSVNLHAIGGSSDYTVTAPANYAVSADNLTFTSSIVIPQADAAAITNFYVRFAPTVKALKLEGKVTITAPGVSKSVSVTGSSFPKSETLDIVSYNLSFFGSNDNNSATQPEIDLQVANITTVLERLNADVIGFQEMSNDVALTTLVGNLPGYASVTAPKWSYSFNPPDPTFPPQKIGFIYNTNTMTLSTTEPPRLLFDQIYEDARTGVTGHPITGYPTGTASSFWSSGRLPYMATFNTNINGVNEKIRIVVLHAKSGSAVGDYNRRVYDLQVLKDSLDVHYPTDKVVILGDYNDRLFGSIAVGSPSSYSMFLNDPARYNPITLPLDQAGRTSFPSRGNLIDHLMVSNELSAQYIATSADIEDPRAYISPYNATTGSDHLPVFARFNLIPIALPVTFTHVQAIQKQKAVTVEWITASETNNAHFIVERSADGATNFQSVGRVNGNGTTTVSHQYWFNDETPLSGNNYYRVKQVDIDGKFSYSKVVRVSFNGQAADKILVSPNPVNRNIRLQLNNNTTVYQLQVFGVDGKLLLQNNGVEMQLNSYLNSEINKLSKGLYFIKVKSGDNTLTSKFVKE